MDTYIQQFSEAIKAHSPRLAIVTLIAGWLIIKWLLKI